MISKKAHKIKPTSAKITVMCLALVALSFCRLWAQPIPVGGIKERQFRILQLLSDSTITTSFLNRPISLSTYRQVFNKSNTKPNSLWQQPITSEEQSFKVRDYKLKIGVYNPVFTNTQNSDLPYGKNNGPAWYGKGFNSELQGGFYVTSKYVTLTLRPDFIYTQNSDFKPPRFIPRYPNGDVRYVNQGFLPEYKLGDRIDRPFRFGPDPFGTIDWGQSSIRLHYKALEAGFSKGTLWWGPGVQYSLIMSNNAAGIRHLFLGTRKPVSIPLHIGKVEFRWVFGWPHDSQYFDLGLTGADSFNVRKQKAQALNSTRILNGINVVYTPSFLPNLSLGIARVIQRYVPSGGLTFTGDILGVFQPFPNPGKGVLQDFRDDSHFEHEDPVSSVFARWALPKADAEFYGEFYKGDHNVNVRDFLTEPQHGRAYTFGVQKLLEYDGLINFLKINAEINSTAEGPIDELRPQTYIYTHTTIRQGYTNRGQILGAEIGPGSQSQYVGMDGYFNKGKVGIFVQREVINNNFFYERQDRSFPQVAGFKDLFHHRINLNVGMNGTYKIGSVLLDGNFTWNRNFNYGRRRGSEGVFFTTPVPIIDNFHYQLAIRYLF